MANSLFRFRIIVILTLISCGGSDFRSTDRKDEDGKIFQKIYHQNDRKLGVLVLTDTNRDGEMDDYLWVRSELLQPEKSIVLFNEVYRENQINQQIFYGPGNLKIYELTDVNEDGIMDTQIYYNSRALPKVLTGIIARAEIDIDQDGTPDFYIFPGKRIEWDSKTNSVCWSESPAILSKALTIDIFQPSIKKELDSLCQKISLTQSWARHPELIKDKQYMASFRPE
jgi:hypothetical protein